jgi:hypothetical protein
MAADGGGAPSMRQFHRWQSRREPMVPGWKGKRIGWLLASWCPRASGRAAHGGGGQPDRAAASAARGERRRRGDGLANETKAEPCWAHVIPRSEIAGTKPPYVCPRCFIHTYSNNMINRLHVQ